LIDSGDNDFGPASRATLSSYAGLRTLLFYHNVKLKKVWTLTPKLSSS